MKINILILFFLLIYSLELNCFYEKEFVSSVISYRFDSSQTVGQSLDFFPNNIYGPPSKYATKYAQASSDSEVVSLGRGGELIVGFGTKKLYNLPGVDFTVFENAFINKGTKKVFAEPAKISVSQDGYSFIDFPYNPTTLKGCAGVTPVCGECDPFNPNESGGDSFDLSELGLEWIKYIKITDISSIVTTDENHPYYQPEGVVLGCDIDAIAGLYLSSESTYQLNQPEDVYFINNNYLIIKNTNFKFIKLFDLMGNQIETITPDSKLHYKFKHSGVYLMYMNQNESSTFNKLYISE